MDVKLESGINIKDLIIEPAQADYRFDPAKEFTVEDFFGYKDKRDNLARIELIKIATTADLKLLFPASDIHQDLDESLWQAIELDLDQARQAVQDKREQGLSLCTQMLRYARVLFPERTVNLRYFPSLWNELDPLMTKRIDDNDHTGYLGRAGDLRYAYEIWQPLANLNPRSAQVAEDRLDHLKRSGDKWKDFAETARDFKLIFPDKFQNYQLGRPEWDSMVKDFRKVKGDPGNHWLTVLEYARFLSVLACNELKVNDKEVEFVWARNSAKSKAELPNIRRF